MTPHKWRTLFYLIIGSCTILYSCFSLWLYYSYHRLDTELPIKTIEWTIDSKDEETHFLKASYSYSFKDRLYEGDHLFKKPVYINRLGAEYTIPDFSKTFRSVWIDSGSPHYSALIKQYPTKELVYTAILWAIFVYFWSFRKI